MRRRGDVMAGVVPSATASYTGTTHTIAAAYHERDGSVVRYLNGKYWLLGGWWDDGTQTWAPDVLTNQVWESADLATWTLDLAHDASPPSTGAGARWTGRHTAWGGVLGGYIYHGWGDTSADRDTWRSNDPGNANGWTRIATTEENRNLPDDLMGCVVWRDAFWMFGGYERGQGTASNKVWRSTDGITWARMGDMPFTRASFGCCVHNDRVFVVGGSTDKGGAPDYLNDTWAFDGLGWRQMSTVSVGYNWPGCNWVRAESYDGRLWVLTGNAPGDTDLTSYSDDMGQTWVRDLAHGWGGSHADATMVDTTHGIIIASGHGHATSVFSLKADP